MSLHLLLFSLFFIVNYLPATANSTQLLSDNPPGDNSVCAGKDCGQGTCKPSNASQNGFDCECKPNWIKIQVFPMQYPSCILPNCTLDMQCGNGSPPPPPPPLNFSSFIPCLLTWCGDGTCVINANGFKSCQCNGGSSNLFNNPAFICLKQCTFGMDCHRLGLGLLTPPPPTKSGSPGNGPGSASSFSRNLRALTMMLLAAIILPRS